MFGYMYVVFRKCNWIDLIIDNVDCGKETLKDDCGFYLNIRINALIAK